jgi:predicted RNase H-like nuclease
MVNENGAAESTGKTALYGGLDGCRAGWLLCAWSPAEGRLSFSLLPKLRDLDLSNFTQLAIDIPIGLTEEGPRRCDLEARKALPRGKGSSVFPAPRRYQLAAATYSEANEAGKAKEGVGLSKQAWNIIPKVAEADQLVTPKLQKKLREAHPELIFHRLAKGRALPQKKSVLGARRRVELLDAAGLTALEPAIRAAGLRRALAADDDFLDAAACAEVARRIAEGAFTQLPAWPDKDKRRLTMEICY